MNANFAPSGNGAGGFGAGAGAAAGATVGGAVAGGFGAAAAGGVAGGCAAGAWANPGAPASSTPIAPITNIIFNDFIEQSPYEVTGFRFSVARFRFLSPDL